MSMSDEAVDAAFAQLPDDFMIHSRGHMRRILEAAAPYIAADAWDEGVSDGQWNAEHVHQIQAGSRHAIENPYRCQA